MILNPLFDQKDRQRLQKSLVTWMRRFTTEHKRRNFLVNAGIDDALIIALHLDDDFLSLSIALANKFCDYSYSSEKPNYHPLVAFSKRICELAAEGMYNLSDQDKQLFHNFVEQGEQKLKALTYRQAIGRIESSPDTKPEHGIGTGILIAPNLLLTCNHIFTKNQIKQAWVRFNYTESSHNLPDDLFELDLNSIKQSSQLDYALIEIKGQPNQKPIQPVNITLNAGQKIRIIHHPAGETVKVSELGEIVKVGKDYIDYNLNTYEGSSGAPIFAIFDEDWQFVAIHRGNPGINAGRNIPSGITSGVPILAFFKEI